jgi:signal transduction histidine kinase
MALADRARAWRAERDAAMRRELEALRVQQQVTQKLHGVERERLEALLLVQSKSQQLAMASHDIRQPLTSLRLTLERLASGGTLAPTVATSFKHSLEYSADPNRGDESSAVAQRASPTFETRALLQNIELMFREEAEAKGLTFRCRIAAASVQGDAMATMRIVSNLVANAIKYTDRGKLLIGCRRRARHVTFVVADTGPGIPADELARVLQPRERGSAVRDTEGQGLGLGIATALAARNGYDFRCESTPGRGTVFYVVVPLSLAGAGASVGEGGVTATPSAGLA